MSQEIDAKVATLVMGLNGAEMLEDEQMFPNHGALPRYTTDPCDDYEVLVHVRDTWGFDRMKRLDEEIESIWKHRAHIDLYEHHTRYEPGDYARAALAVVEAL